MSTLAEYIKEYKAKGFAIIDTPKERYKRHTFFERLRYTYRRRWFVRGCFGLPRVASDFDIFCDYAWRDTKQKTKWKS